MRDERRKKARAACASERRAPRDFFYDLAIIVAAFAGIAILLRFLVEAAESAVFAQLT
jgi:hypothetical protein